MKRKLLLPVFILLSLGGTHAQKVIFLHHSVGKNLYNQGNVVQYINDYNATHATSIQITEKSFPDTPWPWDNYPYDYWKLWAGGSCDNASSSIQCMDQLSATYDVIVFKHCYPGAEIAQDLGTPNITSSRKSLENYKLQYRALRDLMDAYPATRFIVWTLVPKHRLATSSAAASRANDFVTWVKNSWLTEDGKNHPNIHIFDIFNLWAEQSTNPSHGFRYSLKYDFEKSHTASDSHPNLTANEYAGSAFAQLVAEVATEDFSCTEDMNLDGKIDVSDYTQIVGKYGTTCQPSCVEDLDANNTVDISDLLRLIGVFGESCPNP